jgi:hypothetical protein
MDYWVFQILQGCRESVLKEVSCFPETLLEYMHRLSLAGVGYFSVRRLFELADLVINC